MTMALAFRHLPPEVEAARQTLAATCKDAMPTRKAWLSRVLLYVVILAIGAVVGSAAIASGVVSPADKEFWRAGMTAIAVLSGFMVATMVFTGKIEAGKSLSITEFREVARKISYLLLYQFVTLANHFTCLFAMFMTPAIASHWPEYAGTMGVVCLTLFFASIARSVFIPLQIIELHRFTHAAMMRDKSEEAAKASGAM